MSILFIVSTLCVAAALALPLVMRTRAAALARSR
jgi:hypothetical protein